MPEYRFSRGTTGSAGEMPIIYLDREDAVPPINRLYRIEIEFLALDVALSDLHFLWRTEGGIIISLSCKASDERMMKQYKLHKEAATEIVDLLTDVSGKKVLMKISALLPNDEIPDAAKSHVAQVMTWKKFVETHAQGLHPAGRTTIFNGCYLFEATTDSFRRYLEHLDPDGYVEQVASVFDFDPDTQPPKTDDGDYAYWNVPESNIIVSVNFERGSSFESFATFYGFFEKWKKYCDEQEQSEQSLQRAYSALEQSREAKRKEDKKLLSDIFLK